MHPRDLGELNFESSYNLLTTTNTTMTISSVELVKLINELRPAGDAELRHDHLMKKIEKVLEGDAPNFRGIYFDANRREKPCYNLPKREASLMVMSESYAVQAAVYDRMVELEAALPTVRIPQSFREALLLAAEQPIQIA